MSTSSSYDEEEEKLGTSSSGTETGANEGSSTGPTDQYSEMQKFLAGETHRVKIARRFVVISLLVVGCFVSTLVYMILRQRIDDEAADAVSG